MCLCVCVFTCVSGVSHECMCARVAWGMVVWNACVRAYTWCVWCAACVRVCVPRCTCVLGACGCVMEMCGGEGMGQLGIELLRISADRCGGVLTCLPRFLCAVVILQLTPSPRLTLLAFSGDQGGCVKAGCCCSAVGDVRMFFFSQHG